MNAKDFRDEFTPIARRNRNLKRWVKRLVGPLICFLILTWPDEYRIVGIIGAAVCVLLMLLCFFNIPRLICPSCKKPVDEVADTHCPTCGEQPLEKRSTMMSYCRLCARRFFKHRLFRGYQVRYCTHCGANLDEDGV